MQATKWLRRSSPCALLVLLGSLTTVGAEHDDYVTTTVRASWPGP